ncbi:MAG: VWA domain-containing protein [Oligoflexia bacterium]|nr:VWA domain-containing protein [Oligoflexia bacterium]MBF0366847.1 VWA domain-containing protein [Oligoflexia bacterium]
MRFANPEYLFLLLLLIPLVRYHGRNGGRIRYSNLDLLKGLKGLPKFHPRQILLLLRVAAIVLLVLGLARPQAGKKFSEITSEGVDIMLVLDTSGTMQALDFKIDNEPASRLTIVKKVVEDFIKKRQDDRLGLVVFGDEAFTQCPLTTDHGILVEFLKKIEIGMAGDSTAIGSAIGTAINRIKNLPSKSKVVILLTDGRNNAGDLQPLKAAELAKVFGIKVYTIGAGTKGKAPFLQDTLFGKRYVYADVEIDEELLTEVARITGAQYYRATDTGELEKIYAEIDRLEKHEVKVKEYTEYNELFLWFIIPALLLLLLEIGLSQTRLRKIP